MKIKAKGNLHLQLMITKFMKFALYQRSLQVSLTTTISLRITTTKFYKCFLDLRGQKHEVEVTIKMGLEAKNYETVSLFLF